MLSGGGIMHRRCEFKAYKEYPALKATIESQQQEIEKRGEWIDKQAVQIIQQRKALEQAREALKYATARLPNLGYFAACGTCKECGKQIGYASKVVCDDCYCKAIGEALKQIAEVLHD
jgi:hypothetical protein